MSTLKNIKEYAEMIKLGHTLFALPFALCGLCLAIISGYKVSWGLFFLVILCFTGARSAAMGFNRIADLKIDAKNPRTAFRALPDGRISKFAAWFFVIFSTLVFLTSAYFINTLCFVLAFPALVVLFGYSYCKRFTFGCHFVLGIALGLAPVGAWIALAGYFDFKILALAFALLFQISAFDILYSLQDKDFDNSVSLFSIPSKFGEKKSLQICFVLFVLASAMLFLTGFLFNLNLFYFIAVALISLIYFTGFFIFKSAGLNAINTVFFKMNASSSFLILLAVLPKTFL